MRRILVVPVLLAALIAAAACGGSGDKPPAKGGGASPSAAGSLQQFAACMREHGQNVPDPDPNSGNVALTPPAGGDPSAWQAAMRACQQYMPNGGEPVAPDAQELAALRQYAACMREHGVEMTDPDPTTGNGQYAGRFANMSKTQIQNDPTYKTAQAACQSILDNAEPPQKDNE
jgi:hypothetical protein